MDDVMFWCVLAAVAWYVLMAVIVLWTPYGQLVTDDEGLFYLWLFSPVVFWAWLGTALAQSGPQWVGRHLLRPRHRR